MQCIQKTNDLIVNKINLIVDLDDVEHATGTSIYEPRCEKTGLGFPTRSDTNRAVQSQKMASQA